MKYRVYKYLDKSTSVTNEIKFNEESEWKKVRASYGVDPKMTDDELKLEKISFSAELWSSSDKTEYVNLYDFLKDELLVREKNILELNETIKKDAENGVFKFKTIEITNESLEKSIVDEIEKSEGFECWVTEYVLSPLKDAISDAKKDIKKIEYKFFKCDGFCVVVPETAYDLIFKLNDPVEISEDQLSDNYVTIFQYIEYNQSKNIRNTLIDKIVDRDETDKENDYLIDVPDFKMESIGFSDFDSDSVLKKLSDIDFSFNE